MTILALPQKERIPLDANGVPEGYMAARDKAVERLKEMVNELPDYVLHLNRSDAEWIGDQMLLEFVRNLPRVR